MSWFEEMQIGDRRELGHYLFTPEEIVRFARAFDPQPFHLSDEGASKTHFGRLCASGWHTASVWMKLMVAYVQAESERLGAPSRLGPSPGFTDLKWIRPVFAGDTVTYTSTLVEKREMKTRPQWGLAIHANEGVNQDGTLVFSFTGKVLVARRPRD
jgi:acyl dehydratase